MTRVVRVYDPHRDPPEWNRLLRGSEVAVFTEDANAELPATNSLREPTCEIFDDLSAAEVHCKALVASNLKLRCLVFDARGRGGEPIGVYVNPKLRTNEISGRFRRWISAALITIAVLLIWFDWRSEFDRMWPSVLAWKFVTTALVFITWEAVLLAQKILAKRGNSQRDRSAR